MSSVPCGWESVLQNQGGHNPAPPQMPSCTGIASTESHPPTLHLTLSREEKKKSCDHDIVLLLSNAFRRTKVSDTRMYLSLLAEG